MQTYLIMAFMLIVYAAVLLTGARYSSEKENFFDLHDTAMLKGAFCIIVVLVHIPAEYTNKIQDMCGSFAYIGVTFFFMTSAFGLKYGVAHKDGYLRRFWLKRLPAILIPQILCNLTNILLKLFTGAAVSWKMLIALNGWLEILVLFYFVFWIVYLIAEKIPMNNKSDRMPSIVRGGTAKI